MRSTLSRTITVFAWLTAVLVAIGTLPSDLWLVELLSNFRMHLGVAALVLLVPAFRRTGRLAQSVLLFSMVPASLALTSSATGSARNCPAAAPLHVVTYNLGGADRPLRPSIEYLRRQDPDIVVLQEYTAEWDEAVQSLADAFPHSIAEPRSDHFGLAILSRIPLSDAEIRAFPQAGIPYGQVSVRVNGAPLSVIGLHLEWPVRPSSHATQKAQLSHLQRAIEAADSPLVVCGDFNMTPYSHSYATFTRTSGLVDVASIDRLEGTWPARLPGLRIPIDHCFSDEGVSILGKSTGPSLGSDHLPVAYSLSVCGGRV